MGGSRGVEIKNAEDTDIQNKAMYDDHDESVFQVEIETISVISQKN